MITSYCLNPNRYRRMFIILVVILVVVWAQNILFGRHAIKHSIQNMMKYGGNYPNNISRNKVDPLMTSSSLKPKKISASSKSETDSVFSDSAYVPGQEFIKKMMKHAWDGYAKYAWGEDELKPISKSGSPNLCPESMALTMFDSLDTLIIMKMDQEYIAARDYILENVSFDKNFTVSLFETNIRILGGLLSAFALSGDGRLASKAFDIGNRFLSAFEHVIPSNDVNLMGHLGFDNSKAPTSEEGGRFIFLAQAGTLQLEFAYLSAVIKNPVFKERVEAITKEFSQMTTGFPGLYPASIFPGLERQTDSYYTLGGQCDSFYEYLLKYWIFTNKQDELHHGMYKRALEAMKKHLIRHQNGKAFLISRHGDDIVEEQEHLACFVPGMIALGASTEGDSETIKLAEELTESCFEMYKKQLYGLSPEAMNINTYAPVPGKTYWHQRPEVIESLFIMWRVTKDIKYRKWGLEIAKSIEKWARIPTGGYAGINDVGTQPVRYNDKQESYFLAETLKYLYLLFSPDDLLPLDRWVFNTEAHPLPINH